MKRIAVYMMLVLGLMASVVPGAWASPDAARGQKLFQSVGCYECHGTHGAGGGMYAPPLMHTELTAEGIISIVRNPPGNFMPAYSEEVLTDAQIADILAFLKAEPHGRSASEIPLLNH